MPLATKLTYCLIVSCTFYWCSRGDPDVSKLEEDSDEDDKLKQALFLVDILKTEYFKVLRENYELKSGIETTTEVLTEETATCALNETHVSQSTTESSFRTGPDTSSSESTIQSSTVSPESNIPNKLNASRRSFNNIGNNEINMTTPNATNSSSRNPSNHNSNSNLQPGNPSALLEAAAMNKKAPDQKHLKMKAVFNVDGNFNNTYPFQDPVLRQVASELMSELKEDDILRSLKDKKNNKPNITTKFKFNEYMKTRTTLKIYLGHSSKLPIPLPENNPFCYYHPKSSLCTAL